MEQPHSAEPAPVAKINPVDVEHSSYLHRRMVTGNTLYCTTFAPLATAPMVRTLMVYRLTVPGIFWVWRAEESAVIAESYSNCIDRAEAGLKLWFIRLTIKAMGSIPIPASL